MEFFRSLFSSASAAPPRNSDNSRRARLLTERRAWVSHGLMFTSRAKWIKFLAAILLGNALYFLLSPHLPPVAQHHSAAVDLGTVVDFWFCLCVYGIIELAIFLRSRGQPTEPKE
jgi:hypothetical protein